MLWRWSYCSQTSFADGDTEVIMHPVTLHLVSINTKKISTIPVFEKDIATHWVSSAKIKIDEWEMICGLSLV